LTYSLTKVFTVSSNSLPSEPLHSCHLQPQLLRHTAMDNNSFYFYAGPSSHEVSISRQMQTFIFNKSCTHTWRRPFLFPPPASQQAYTGSAPGRHVEYRVAAGKKCADMSCQFTCHVGSIARLASGEGIARKTSIGT
jgi:hypothetical protein